MKNKTISRRAFIRDSSLATVSAVGSALAINGCAIFTGPSHVPAWKLRKYNPKKDGGCAVSFGYDVDMPSGGDDYFYEKSLPWRGFAHGHLNQDVRDYIEHIVTLAEDYETKQQFFIQGNTFEKEKDVTFWKKIAKRGHAIDSHMYSHDNMLEVGSDEVKSQLAKTKRLIETKLGVENIGVRSPGGYRTALKGRKDIQKAVLDAGLKWGSTQYIHDFNKSDSEQATEIVDEQWYYYETGLLEIPFCGAQDRTFFDTDCGGDPTRTPNDWIAYLKHFIDVAYEKRLFLTLTVHPSTSFKHDPQAKYVTEIFSYCRQKPDIVLCTYQDMYRWIISEKNSSGSNY